MKTMRPIPSPVVKSPRRAAGFTIIELMVGMLVGLLATIVMFQVFAVSEGQKRTTTGAGDAQQNGVGSVFVLEREARMAGFGLSYANMLGCPISGLNTDNGNSISFTMTPYVIVDGAAGSPDVLTLAFGDTRSFASPQKLSADATPGGLVKVYNRFGLSKGDLFVLASTTEPGCTLYQVKDLPGSDSIDASKGSFTDANGVTRDTTYNKAGGNTTTTYKKWDIAKSRGTRILNIGQRPTVVTYSLVGSQLVMNDILNPGPPVVVSDGIVQFQVQYGLDNGTWADSLASPTTAVWGTVIGIRFAIVSRSATPERPDPATGVCATTTVGPTWQATGRILDVSADPNWKCYRYRVFEVTVPARNLIWHPNEDA
jgi:type IV pilus assembly protein PilW